MVPCGCAMGAAAARCSGCRADDSRREERRSMPHHQSCRSRALGALRASRGSRYAALRPPSSSSPTRLSPRQRAGGGRSGLPTLL
eukprot:scaffold37433_cov33-Tisochrysis_lutea.AAC.3